MYLNLIAKHSILPLNSCPNTSETMFSKSTHFAGLYDDNVDLDRSG